MYFRLHCIDLTILLVVRLKVQVLSFAILTVAVKVQWSAFTLMILGLSPLQIMDALVLSIEYFVLLLRCTFPTPHIYISATESTRAAGL